MALEIERRFLVAEQDAKTVIAGLDAAAGIEIVQGYLTEDPDRALRVRIAGPKAYLTLKGRKTQGAGTEIESEIPIEIARALMEICGAHVVRKTRYRIPYGDLAIELDVFASPVGLIVAEVELPSIDTPLDIPSWFGREITDAPEYSNQSLAFRGAP